MGLRKFNHWLVSGVLIWSVAMPAAQAESKQAEILLNAQGNQTFESLMQRADSIARESLDSGFADSAVTEVAVKVSGEREGQVSPLLYVRVSRSDWQKSSSVRQWARYFGGSTILLGYGRSRSTDTQMAAASTWESSSESEPNFYDSK